jgi:histidinol-phosphate aminotransferase
VELFTAGGHEVVPSQANFVLVPVSDEPAFVEELAQHGISVRPGASLGVPGTVRVSVPDDDGLALVARALTAPTDALVAHTTTCN